MITPYHPTKAGNNATLKKGIDYILNQKKTQNGYYTGALNCSTSSALNDMIQTKQFYGKDDNDRKSRTGYHWTISWSPEEHVDYDIALKIVQEFCEKFLKDYECVYSVHTDKAHTHCHLIFNSVNFQTGRKFRYEDGDWAKIYQPELDRLCKKYGLHTLEQDTGMTNEQYFKEQSQNKNPKKKKKRYQKQNQSEGEIPKRRGNNKYYNDKTAEYTKSDFIKKEIDDAILLSYSLDEFFSTLESWGYKIRYGKSEKYGDYFALSGRGMDKARRNYVLGKDYSIESIKKRIEIKNNPLPEYSMPQRQDMSRFIVHYIYWQKPKYGGKYGILDPNNSFLAKRVCYLQYKKGILDTGHGRPNYYDIKQSLKKIREYEQKMELIHDYQIGDVQSADAALDNLNGKLSELDSKRKDVYVNRKPYKGLLNTYNEMKKVEMGFYSYENGLIEYKEAHDKYIELKEVLDKYGFSESDIDKYQEELKAELKSISYEKRQIKKKMKFIHDIRNLAQNQSVSLDEIEQDYDKIPDPDTYRKNDDNNTKDERDRNKQKIF